MWDVLVVDCPECRFGDSHSPAGVAELTYLLGLVARSRYQIATFLYPRTYSTLLRYPYSEMSFRAIL